MTIDTTLLGLSLDMPVLTRGLGAVITLEVRTMRDEIKQVHLNFDFPAKSTDYVKRPETLLDLINFAMHRQHPIIQYVADRNGLTLVHYSERLSFSQSMRQIEYS